MRKGIFAIAICAALLVVVGYAGQARAADEFTGEVIDKACFDKNGAHGADHADCAKSCLERGGQMGLLTADGEVILLRPNADDSAPFEALKALAGGQAKVMGMVSEEDGFKVVTVTGSSAAN